MNMSGFDMSKETAGQVRMAREAGSGPFLSIHAMARLASAYVDHVLDINQ